MRGINARSNGLMFVVGLWVIMGAAIAAGHPSNHHNPNDVFPDPTPIWDKVLPTAERFVILSAFGGAAVRDNETGLVWQKNPDLNQSAFFYSAGVVLCQVAKTGGRMGWRLPTIPELSSLADGTNATPGTLSLPPGHPFSNVTADTVFFTLGIQETSPSTFEIIHVKFTPGGPGGIIPISMQFAPKFGVPARAWCVRSGNPVLPE